MSDIAHAFVAASGTAPSDCALLAQRWDADLDGYRHGSGETHIMTVSPTTARLELGGVTWLTGIWRSPGRTVFVSDADGYVHVLRPGEAWRELEVDGTLIGVWGLEDETVWTWGSRGTEHVLYRWNGTGFLSVESPGPIVAMGGHDVTALYAVGHGGLVARFDGHRWTRLESGTRISLNGVCVISDDEVYATAPEGVLFEGSAYGWTERARPGHLLHSIGAYGGTIYVGANEPFGLMKLDGDALATVHPKFTTLRIDAREQLLLTTPNDIVASTDAQTWTGMRITTFERLVASYPPEWR